jgi:hypothetical protein
MLLASVCEIDLHCSKFCLICFQDTNLSINDAGPDIHVVLGAEADLVNYNNSC